MAQRSPDMAKQDFQPWLVPSADRARYRVLRESENLDLVIELPGYETLVIENETFSMPDEAQLERYTTGPVCKMAGTPTTLPRARGAPQGGNPGRRRIGGGRPCT